MRHEMSKTWIRPLFREFQRLIPKTTGKLPNYCWKELILKGETKTVEFKSTLRYCLHRKSAKPEIEHSSFKNIAAFLNSEGGHLFIGVDDQGKLLGLDNDFQTFRDKNKEDAFRKHFDNLVSNTTLRL